MNEIKLILGTMTFGSQVNENNAQKILSAFLDCGHFEIDTAYVYNNGSSEKLVGKILENLPINKYSIATKVNPRITGQLDEDSINRQFAESLHRLSRKSVDILYLHFPDAHTPLEITLGACAKLYEQGKFTELGLSNFPAWMVVDAWHICKVNGWPRPTVYQGLYNGLSRNVENELFPALRKLEIRFYAFNPLAGGILTGKYKVYNCVPEPGRFTYRPNYKDRYWKKTYFSALEHISSACQGSKVTILDAAYRWLAYHSMIEPSMGDGIVIGVSRIEQLDQNLSAIKKGPLPERIICAFDDVWGKIKSECPDYFRFIVNKSLENDEHARSKKTT